MKININMDSDKMCIAWFRKKTYTLTINVSGNGSVAGAGTYDKGTVVDLNTLAEEGYQFSHWEGDLEGDTNPTEVTMNSNKTITAYFTAIEYTLTTGVDPEGSGTITGAGTYPAGANVEVEAIPNEDYEFDHWNGEVEIPVGTIIPQDYATGDGTESNPWANDCIKKAYDVCPINGTIYFKAGHYQLANSLNGNKAINIIGEGREKTFVITADTYGFNVTADHVTIKGMTIDGAAQASGDKMAIGIAHCDYITLEDIEAKNCITAGIQNFESNYSSYKNIYTHDNGTAGFHPCTDTAGKNIHNTYQNIYCYDNGVSGFGDRGKQVSTPIIPSYNVYDNLQCWDNGVNGIAIVYQSGIELSNSSSTGNTGSGLYLTYIEDSTINNCSFTLNGVGKEQNGILLSAGVKNVNFTNVIVKNNETGINIFNAENIVFTSCQSYDDRVIPLQWYGMQLNGTNTGIKLINCKLSPNRYGDIYNPNGAIIIIEN